jgi:rhodanese-related sulfurtransferase
MKLFKNLLSPTPAVDVQEAMRRIQQDDAYLLDVRERDEFREVRARGAARISLGQVEQQLDRVPRGRPVLVICRSGARSAHATDTLRRAGIDASNVTGGTLAWVAAGLPTERGGS